MSGRISIGRKSSGAGVPWPEGRQRRSEFVRRTSLELKLTSLLRRRDTIGNHSEISSSSGDRGPFAQLFGNLPAYNPDAARAMDCAAKSAACSMYPEVDADSQKCRQVVRPDGF